MSTFPQDINSAIDRYRGLVRAGEQRAMRVAEDEPRRAAVIGNLYRGVMRRLSALWAHRVQAVLRSVQRRASRSRGEAVSRRVAADSRQVSVSSAGNPPF